MKSPFTGGKVKLIKELKEMEFRNESIEILYHSWRCIDTGELFTDEKLDNLNVNQVHNKYREKHNIPFPDQIKETRKKYGLSATKMSELLGFGVNTYRNYENGKVPQSSNAKLIKLAEKPREFFQLVTMSNVFDDDKKQNLLSRINQMIEQERHSEEHSLKRLLSDKSRYPNIFTGYREMRLEKFFNMILFFAEHVKPFKTRLNKLMFYADFVNYKKTGFSISGANYVAIKYGPVPDEFNTLYDAARRNRFIEIEYHELSDFENVGEEFKPYANRSFEQELFDNNELANIELVAKNFKGLNTEQLVEKTHNERAWLERKKQNGMIEYDYAFDLEFEEN